MSRSKQSFLNFKKALDSLEQAVSLPPLEDRDYGGIIKAFETVYELTWKTLKIILESNGIAAPFPRVAFEEAFKRGMIEGNEIWKDIMEARNKSVHTYDKEMTAQLCRDITLNYVPVFKSSCEKIKPFV